MIQDIVRKYRRYFFLFLLSIIVIFLSSSCTRLLGYGVLLWSVDDPPMPSGTVVPVYIRSNINQVWVVGIPKKFRNDRDRVNKFEIPLPKLELAGSRKKANTRAEAFAPYALVYAETLQDGLPIRERPDNVSRRVYRLRLGEVIKILAPANGAVAVGASGDPLPGDWYQVLTTDGTIGFCFSYRLRLFKHLEGPLAAALNDKPEPEDPVLERLLSRTWSPESYATMVNNRRIDLEELSFHWRFDPGQETGTAWINVRELDRTFSYTKISSTGTQSWRFDGSPLQMSLRSENILAVHFTEDSGILRTLLFAALPSSVDDIILQESARRERLIRNLFEEGPVYISSNHGTLTFQEDGRFTWTNNMLLVPQIIPGSALSSGTVDMRLFLSNAMSERFTGAFTFRFDGIGGARANVDFMYRLDPYNLWLEYVPQISLDDLTVVRRASSPTIINFFKPTRSEERAIPQDSWDYPLGTFDTRHYEFEHSEEGFWPETEY
jgi:hypothetical protein